MPKLIIVVLIFTESLMACGAAPPSGTGGIAESYAALPASGGVVKLGHDFTIATPQTLTLSKNKSLFLDLNGHTITCANSKDACLTIFKPDSTPRYQLAIYQGHFIYRGSSSGVVGLALGDDKNPITNLSVHDLVISGFSTSGSIALSLVNAQDGHYDSISFSQNFTALFLGLSTIQNQFSNLWFQENTNAIQAIDAAEASFIDCLIQSSKGTNPVQIISKTTNITNINFQHCHFENNGDGTENARQVFLRAEAGRYILNTEFTGNTFNAGQNAAKSTVFEFSGPGTFYGSSFVSNQYNISNHQMGVAKTRFNAFNDKMQQLKEQ